MTLFSSPRAPCRDAWRVAVVAAAFVVSGCAGFSDDGGFAPVEQAARARLGKEVTWARSDREQGGIDRRVAELLARPLSADDAVQVALLNNKGLQATFFELGIAEADLVQAGRLPNPGFNFGRLAQGTEVEIDRSLQFDLVRLLTMPVTRQLEARRLEQTRTAVIVTVLSLANQTRKAYFAALAADETARYAQQVQDAAEAGAELARRQAQVGNWSRLEQAREQGFYADAALSLARAEQSRSTAREQLTRLLGLWGAQTAFQLPEHLPALPDAPDELPDVEQAAMARRLDVQTARQNTEQLAQRLGLTEATRFVNVLELGAVRNTFNDLPVQRGYTVSVELPIFDTGSARVAKAEAIYRQSLERAAETAINARSEVRQAYRAMRSRFDIARHFRDEIVPLKKRISAENQLRYNGMLIGVFELLADARSQITSVQGYIDALCDFWNAQADLDMAFIGKPASPGAGQ